MQKDCCGSLHRASECGCVCVQILFPLLSKPLNVWKIWRISIFRSIKEILWLTYQLSQPDRDFSVCEYWLTKCCSRKVDVCSVLFLVIFWHAECSGWPIGFAMSARMFLTSAVFIKLCWVFFVIQLCNVWHLNEHIEEAWVAEEAHLWHGRVQKYV